MLRKFLFMLSLLCAFTAGTSSVMAADQTFGSGNNTVTLKTSSDGKTLTISGKGDLTALDANYTFKATALNVIYKQNGSSYASVNTNDAYETTNTYYTRTEKYTEITGFATSHVTTKTHYYFTAAAAKKYYTEASDWSTGSEVKKYTPVTEGSEVNTTNSVWTDSKSESIYFTKNDGEETYTRVADASSITSNSTDATSKDIKHLSNCNDVFVKNGASYSLVYNDAEYQDGQTYYQRSYEYTAISLDNLKSGDYVSNTNEFIKALWKVGSEKQITTVTFENEDSSNPLYIDNDIVKAILYYQETSYGNVWYTINGTITSFDLSAATVKNLSQATFTNDLGANGTWAINHISLPLTEKDENNDMTVPTMVLQQFNGENGTQSLATITVPDGYTKIADKAFYYYEGITFTLPNGITEIGESAFAGTTQTDWTLPTSLKTIGNSAFVASSVTNVTFPESLRNIGHMAFSNCKSLADITLNEGLDVISNSAFFLDGTITPQQLVLQVPASVKYIGPGAFYNRRYMDVYYYGEKAPLSPYGSVDAKYDAGNCVSAFGAEVHMGNNGFSPANYEEGKTLGNTNDGYANRENYNNNGNYISVLHFRSDLNDEQAETFTDITRKYERWMTEKTTTKTKEDGTTYDEGTGEFYWYKAAQKKIGNETTQLSWNNNTDAGNGYINPGYEDTALGSQLIWPSQVEWMRSYIANSLGLKWDGVTTYRPTLTEAEKELIRTQEGWSDKTAVTDDDLSKLAYMSTRQFVLVSRDVNGKKPDEYPVPVDKGERWWTLCVPCDVTKGEVDKVFGQNTHLCLFSKVVRKVDETNGNEIHLYFQQDTYKNKYTRNADGTWTKGEAVSDDNDIVLYAHTPYMIYPANRKDDGMNYVLTSYTLQSGDALPTVLASVNSADATEADAESVKYMFTSNYRGKVSADDDTETKQVASRVQKVQKNVTIPQYSYVFGRTNSSDASGKSSKFFFYTGTSKQWSTNKCIVERYDAQGSQDENDFFAKLNNGAKANTSIFGEDNGSTTGVDKVVYHMGEDSDAPVYNLNGQMVSRDGSLSGLASGIYVQGGKKFIVK